MEEAGGKVTDAGRAAGLGWWALPRVPRPWNRRDFHSTTSETHGRGVKVVVVVAAVGKRGTQRGPTETYDPSQQAGPLPAESLG